MTIMDYLLNEIKIWFCRKIITDTIKLNYCLGKSIDLLANNYTQGVLEITPLLKKNIGLVRNYLVFINLDTKHYYLVNSQNNIICYQGFYEKSVEDIEKGIYVINDDFYNYNFLINAMTLKIIDSTYNFNNYLSTNIDTIFANITKSPIKKTL